jgi:hypothetical protein
MKNPSTIITMSANGNFVHGKLAFHLATTSQAMMLNAQRLIEKHIATRNRQSRNYAKGNSTLPLPALVACLD